jgi:hypothetical protein
MGEKADKDGNLLQYKHSPRCARCGIRLHGYRAPFFSEYQTTEFCGECVLEDIDPNPKILTRIYKTYSKEYIETHPDMLLLDGGN